MHEASPLPVMWKPHKPIAVDAIVDYGAFDIMADCCLLHCQTDRAKAWVTANVENLASLVWGEAVCVQSNEIGPICWGMRQAGLKIAELGIG